MKLIPLLVIFSSIFSGCGSHVTKPQLELCLIILGRGDIPDGCTCGLTNPAKIRSLSQVSYGKAIEFINDDPVLHPMSYCDRSTALRPAEWEKLNNYMHDLEIENKKRGLNYEK